MTTFQGYEKEVVTLLTRAVFSEPELDAILEHAELVSIEHTGVGYYLTVRHPELPRERVVCNEPGVGGTGPEVDCGFVVFLENGELTLECHSWGNESIPEDVRSRALVIEVTE